MIIAVCEDEKEELEKTYQLIMDAAQKIIGNFSVKTYGCAEDLLENISANPPDIVFSDIYMQDISGIDAAKELKKLPKQIEVVFLTSSEDHILESYEIDAAHYLLKPVVKSKIEDALKRCLKRLGIEETFLEFKVGKKNIRLIEQQINYLESMGNTTFIYSRKEEIKIYQTLKEIEQQLRPDIFLKIQRGIIVNMKFIKHFKSDECVLKNEQIIKLSRKEKNLIRQKYVEYQFECARKRGE